MANTGPRIASIRGEASIETRWKNEGTLVAHGLRGYLAGLLDGDGTITPMISRSGPSSNARRDRRYWAVAVKLNMTTKEPLELLQRLYGGQIHRTVERGARAHFRPVFGWRAINQHAAQWLHDARPWLILKAEQADIALRLAELTGPATQGFRAPTPPETIREIQSLIQRLVVLNGRKTAPVFRSNTLYIEDTRERTDHGHEEIMPERGYSTARWSATDTLMEHGLRGYFAGIIDSEGSIIPCIGLSGPPDARAKGPRYWAVRLEIGMTDTAVPELFQRIYGGTVRTIRDQRARHRAVHRWTMLNKHAGRVLRDALPWLLVKREQAEIAIRLSEVSAKARLGRRGVNNVDAAREKQTLIQRLVACNGRSEPPSFRGDTLYVLPPGRGRRAV